MFMYRTQKKMALKLTMCCTLCRHSVLLFDQFFIYDSNSSLNCCFIHSMRLYIHLGASDLLFFFFLSISTLRTFIFKTIYFPTMIYFSERTVELLNFTRNGFSPEEHNNMQQMIIYNWNWKYISFVVCVAVMQSFVFLSNFYAICYENSIPYFDEIFFLLYRDTFIRYINIMNAKLFHRCFSYTIHNNAGDSWASSYVYGIVIRAICRTRTNRNLSTILSIVRWIGLRYGVGVCNCFDVLQRNNLLDNTLYVCIGNIWITMARLWPWMEYNE